MAKTRHFGRMVRERRETLGLSIEKAAELCELSAKGLEKIELSDSNPKLTSVLNIVTGLDMNIEDLSFCLPDLKR